MMNSDARGTPTRSLGMMGAIIVMLITLLVAALLVVQPGQATSSEVIKRAKLSGSSTYPAVNGEAKWTSKGGERELEVQIEDAEKLAGKTLAVRIGGKLVGSMKVNSLGRARLELTTEAGHNAPSSVDGKKVGIPTKPGTLVASGRF